MKTIYETGLDFLRSVQLKGDKTSFFEKDVEKCHKV